MKKKENIKKTAGLPDKLYKGVLLTFLGIFLLGNIVSSQALSSLFPAFLEGKKDAVVIYLKKIKMLSFFNRELLLYKNRYGAEVETLVFESHEKRTERIKQLEEELKKNGDARDVLFNLSLLYKEEGMKEKAADYFQRAKKIDPLLKEE